MIDVHLPALQVVVPLLAAPACVIAHRAGAAWVIAFVTSVLATAMSARLLSNVLAQGPIAYFLGNWAPPWGIEYRVDELNSLVLLIVSVISTLSLAFARRTIEREVPLERVYLLYTCWLLCLTGLLGIAITGDAFNIFVFLEISSLSTYVLISLSRERRALVAAFQYLVLGTIGATFILIGIGLLYQATGTLNIADLAERVRLLDEQRNVTAAFAFIVVGVGLKAAVFPLHAWLPNAYTYAPSAVTAFLAGTATKVAIYLLIRLTLVVFGYQFVFEKMALGNVLLALAMAGILAASLIAVGQTDAKRLFAFSSVAQIGYMVLGVGYGSVVGLSATLVHMFNHALMKTALFMALGCIVYRVGSARFEDLAGVGRRMPLTMAALVIAGLSLIGTPLTAGFISKWYLLLGALDEGWWPVAAVILIGSILAVVYLWRVVEVAYFKPGRHTEITEAPLELLVPLWLLVAANVYFGIDSELPVGVAEAAAVRLLGAGG